MRSCLGNAELGAGDMKHAVVNAEAGAGGRAPDNNILRTGIRGISAGDYIPGLLPRPNAWVGGAGHHNWGPPALRECFHEAEEKPGKAEKRIENPSHFSSVLTSSSAPGELSCIIQRDLIKCL